jgi:hypothetical protein
MSAALLAAHQCHSHSLQDRFDSVKTESGLTFEGMAQTGIVTKAQLVDAMATAAGNILNPPTNGAGLQTNGAGIELSKLHQSTGRPKGARNLRAKHPSSIAKAFKRAGLDWQQDFALAIKANNGRRIKLWLKLLPYLITQTNHSTKVRKWRGKASKAAIIALDALEGR